MRITAGQYRGRELVSPKSAQTHPMGERERLALFNSLASLLSSSAAQPDQEPQPTPFSGLQVLDAYAGTGALGLEALSRGVAAVTFIENHPAALKALRQNLANLSAKATILSCSVQQAHLAEYDLILADPPYATLSPTSPQYQTTLQSLAHLAQALRPTGLLVLSHPADFNHKDFATSNHLQQVSTKSYAAANLSIFTPLPIA